MSLELIKSALIANNKLASQMSFDAWIADQEMRGQKVKLFRDYADGDHRANLTPEMRKLLRINLSGSLNEFNDNYMDIIIQTVVDRLELTGVEGDDDEAEEPEAPAPAALPQPQQPQPMMQMMQTEQAENGDTTPDMPMQLGQPPQPAQPQMPEKPKESASTRWASDMLKRNRFDAMQSDIWEAAIRDGDTFVMVYYDNEQQRVRFSHEPAFDGVSGMLVLYETMASEKPLCAIKVWRITTEGGKIGDTMRVNVYYEDRIEKYISRGDKSLEQFEATERWIGRDGEPIGVPVIHFRNRKAMYDNYGMSEIENAIPLQDALNRTLYSMVMSAELSAFQIRWAKGFRPPADLAPGMWVLISPDTVLSPEDNVDLGVMEQGDISPYIDMSRHIVGEMGNITNTPRLTPQGMGSDASSGEALKQREIGLIGKVKRFQVKAGNMVEDMLSLAARVQQTFGSEQPPESEFFYSRWKDPEIRNEVSVIDNALKIVDYVDERTFLELVAPVYGWDAKKIDLILEANAKERAAKTPPMPINMIDIGAAQERVGQIQQGMNNGANLALSA